MLKKVVVIGPECTGKSVLCEQLAQHYNTDWCPEFAREYLLKHGKDYSYDDLLVIANGQLASEDQFIGKLLSGNPLSPSPLSIHHYPLFIDTDMYVMKVWCEFALGKCHPYILEQIVERKYDLYLLCNIDLPWVKDELREYPDLATRQRLFLMYMDLMVNQSVPWKMISGDPGERLKLAIQAISELP